MNWTHCPVPHDAPALTSACFAWGDLALVGVMVADFITPPYLWVEVPRPLSFRELRTLVRSMDELQENIAPVVWAESIEAASHRLVALGFSPLHPVEDRILLERTI